VSEGAIERFQDVLPLIEADRPLDIPETYATIQAAADAGDAHAMRLAAYAAGVGYGRSIDLEDAIRWLARSAESGDASAREQLSLLKNGAARADIGAWIAARPARVVHDAPRISVSDGFLDSRLCAWLIKRGAPLQQVSHVYDPKTGHGARNEARTNSVASFKLTDLDLPLILIRHRIASTIGVPVEHFERTSVFRYLPGQSFADHADYISTSFSAEIRQRGQRPFTFLVYLNDAFEGGETHFLRIDKKFRGGVGDALFWRNVDERGAPDESTQHAGAPPARGEKWLLSQFVRDKAQLPG
jgi:prolyl 4-hydroxylase